MLKSLAKTFEQVLYFFHTFHTSYFTLIFITNKVLLSTTFDHGVSSPPRHKDGHHMRPGDSDSPAAAVRGRGQGGQGQGRTGQDTPRRRLVQPKLLNDLNAPHQCLRYYKELRNIMEYKDKVVYLQDKV